MKVHAIALNFPETTAFHNRTKDKGFKMVWLAYSGFTGSIVLSIVFLTMMMGMPALPALSLAVQTGVILLAAAAVTTLIVTELRKRIH